MTDSMRGLFFIVKGQYRKGVGRSFLNEVTETVQYTGGYDPESDTTSTWYSLRDSKTFHCIACGSDLNKVLKGVYTSIIKHKGVAKNYFKYLSDFTHEDYYEKHYHNTSRKSSTTTGSCPAVSPSMKCLYKEVYRDYGDHYAEEIEKMEELAYKDLVMERPYNKSRKLVSKTKKNTGGVEITPREEVVIGTPTPIKVKPKARLGIKKLI